MLYYISQYSNWGVYHISSTRMLYSGSVRERLKQVRVVWCTQSTWPQLHGITNPYGHSRIVYLAHVATVAWYNQPIWPHSRIVYLAHVATVAWYNQPIWSQSYGVPSSCGHSCLVYLAHVATSCIVYLAHVAGVVWCT